MLVDMGTTGVKLLDASSFFSNRVNNSVVY